MVISSLLALFIALASAQCCQNTSYPGGVCQDSQCPGSIYGRYNLTWPVMPRDGVDPPLLNNTITWIIGCGSIGSASARMAYSLGSTVICTTTNVSRFRDRGLVPLGVHAYYLDYRDLGSVREFVMDARQDFGMPDYLIDTGLTTINGNPATWPRGLLRDALLMYIEGPIELERQVFKRHRGDKHLKWLKSLSLASKALIPVFQEIYNIGKVFAEKHILSLNAQKIYPNASFYGAACTFVQGNISRNTINPSAESGDTCQQVFQAVITAAGDFLGRDPDDMARAYWQILTRPDLYPGHSIFQIPPKYPLNSTCSEPIAMAAFMDSKQYTEALPGFILGRFPPVDITNHGNYSMCCQ